MQFTIFGASGFIGSNLEVYLRGQGHSVNTPRREEQLDPRANLGHVIYAVGMTGDFRTRPFETIESHVTALSNLLRRSSFDSWLYLSSTRIYRLSDSTSNETDSISVIPGSDGIYDISKLLGEALCLAMKHPAIRVVRLSNVYGVGQSKNTFLGDIIGTLASGGDVTIQESPTSSKDYITIAEVVQLIEKIVLNGKHNIYNVASGLNTSHLAISRIIEAVLDVEIEFIENAQERIFTNINVNRIKNEFSFEALDIKDVLPEILKTMKIQGT